MNYLEWSDEYNCTAKELACTIEKLKKERNLANVVNRKDIDLKIAKYKMYYNECLSIANHLFLRYVGVE